MNDFSTIADLVFFQKNNFSNDKLLNFKENRVWRSFSNKEFFNQISYFACGLKELGLVKNQKLAIASYQNPIWLITDLGSILAGLITVPIFHNISKENLFYEISDSAVSVVFTDNMEIFNLLKSVPDLKIITYGFKKENSICFEELILLGKEAIKTNKYDVNSFTKELTQDDLATIIYTSGSTGVPKGVSLTHQNLISQIKATMQVFPLDKKEDVVLSFLPLAHIFERMVMMFYLTQGVSIYFADDTKNVGSLLKEINPSLMTVVPRVLEKVFIRIRENVENSKGLKKLIAKLALKKALKEPLFKKSLGDKIFDILVYKKFRAALGQKMRMIICGGAALSKEMESFYTNIGVNLYCGYGLTEASPVLAVNNSKAHKFATIGKAFPFVELKISQDGELLAKGPNIMRGYHNQIEKTSEVIVDGWLKTGDLAKIDEKGFVTIIGRKKELFKTANGKYVSPVPIEQKIVQNLGFLVGAIIIAEGKKFTSALIFPDFEILEKTKNKLKFNGSDEEFLKSNILSEFCQRKINKINAVLDHHEQIQKFAIINQEISIENGEITPSMKLKRNVLEDKFRDIINGFYDE